MRVAVIGSSGYLAGFVMRRLLERGLEPVGLQRSATKGDPVCELVRYTGLLDLAKRLETLRPDLVINMANFYTRDAGVSTSLELASVNGDLIGVLAESCAVSSSSLLHVGSGWQHDTTSSSGPLPEAPLYSMHRGIASYIGKWYSQNRGVSFQEVALLDTYGPLDPRGKLPDVLLRAAAGLSDLPVLASPHQDLFLVHATDVARHIVQAAEDPGMPGAERPTLCGPTRRVSVEEIVMLVESITGTALSITYSGANPRRPAPSMTDFSELPGWTPTVSLEDGLRESWTKWFHGVS